MLDSQVHRKWHLAPAGQYGSACVHVQPVLALVLVLEPKPVPVLVPEFVRHLVDYTWGVGGMGMSVVQ